jgi:hypothetical protein
MLRDLYAPGALQRCSFQFDSRAQEMMNHVPLACEASSFILDSWNYFCAMRRVGGIGGGEYMQHYNGEKGAVAVPGTFAEWRKLNWTAIAAGVVAMLGLEAFLLAFGGAVGLSTFNFYDFAGTEAPYKVPVATILWLALAVLSSTFFGAWIAGHWANLEEGEDAVMHGALTWALGVAVASAGIFSMAETGAGAAVANPAIANAGMQSHGNNNDNNKGGDAQAPLSFSALDDPAFANFMMKRADSFAQQNRSIPTRFDRTDAKVPDQAIETTTDKEAAPKASSSGDAQQRHQVKPDDMAKNIEYKTFVMSQTGISEDQAEQFLKENKQALAQAQANSQRNWEQANARELARAEKMRKASSVFAWTMTVIGLLALGAAVGGSYLGWTARYHPELVVVETRSTGVSDTTGEPM